MENEKNAEAVQAEAKKPEAKLPDLTRYSDRVLDGQIKVTQQKVDQGAAPENKSYLKALLAEKARRSGETAEQGAPAGGGSQDSGEEVPQSNDEASS